MSFTLIHPSRGRALKSKQTYDAWSSAAKYPDGAKWLCSLDWDDDIGAYMDAYTEHGIPRMSPIISKNKSAVDAINNAASHWRADGDIFIVVSDDTEPCVHWDEKILNEVEGKTDWILKTQDGIQKWIITMPIMDRAYYNRFGYIYYPEYRHLFCDTELTCVADITGRKITSNLLFPHNHYSIGKSVKDEVSIRADNTQSQGEKLFIERYKRNFDLPKGNKIQAQGMIDWLIKKHVPV
jgi:hypothetical protein